MKFAFVNGALSAAVVAIAAAGCTVNAPAAEDLQGDGFAVNGGVLSVDDTKVPVVDACEDGQVVAKVGAGWGCVALADGTVAGDGLVVDGDTIAADFGDGATQVASGERIAQAEGAITALDDNVTDLDARISVLEIDVPAVEVGVSALEGRATTLEAADVALAADISAVEVDISALETADTALAADISAVEGDVTAVEGDVSAVEDRVTVVEGKTFADFFVSVCNAQNAGGLNRLVNTLRVCDGVEFRNVTLAPPTPPTLIADYDQANVTTIGRSLVWGNGVVGGDPLFLGFDIGLAVPAPPGVPGIGRIGGGGGGGFAQPSGHRRLTLPQRGFTIEVVFTGNDTIISHGQNGLSLSFFGTGPNIRELGRDTRYAVQTAPDNSRPIHLVYVHENDDTRSVYVNGTKLQPEVDQGTWTGPYFGGDDVFSLGSLGGGGAPAGSGLLHHRIRIHGVALDGPAVRANCLSFSPALVPSCS